MMTVAELMQAHLSKVFNERDDERRRTAISAIYTADVSFADPEEVVTGHEDLNAKARRLLAEAPTFTFSATGPTLVNHDLGYLPWGFGPAGEQPVVRGIDIVLVQDGLIKNLYTLLLTD